MSASLLRGGLRLGAYLQGAHLQLQDAYLQRPARALCRVAAVAGVAAALGLVPAAAQIAKTTPAPATARSTAAHPTTSHADASRAHVYLMRGLLNVFSLGMDQLAAQVARNGIDATVYNHSVEESVVATIVQKYRGGDRGPYILVGHSLGADAVMLMAQQLDAQGVPVALVVPFDGTESYAAPANVSCVVNLTQRKYAYMQAGAGFRGKLSNVDVSSDTTIDHITIDKSPRLQAIALKEILQAAHGQSCRPGQNAPAVARTKAPSEIAPKDKAAKDSTINNSATSNSTTKDVVAPNHAAPAKSAVPSKNVVPGAPAKTTSPTGAAPQKSAAARSS